MDLFVIVAPEGFLRTEFAALACILAVQWLKLFVTEARWYNLMGLGLTLLAQLGAVAISGTGLWFEAAWAGVLGASLATFGYEGITNLLGLAGRGPRATPAK